MGEIPKVDTKPAKPNVATMNAVELAAFIKTIDFNHRTRLKALRALLRCLEADQTWETTEQ